MSGQAFSGGGGRYSRVFIGVAEGWLSDTDSYPTAEDIGRNFDKIQDRSSYIVPESIFDELSSIADRIAERDAATA